MEQKPEAQDSGVSTVSTATTDSSPSVPLASRERATLPGRGGYIGVKAGMTQFYDEDGQAVAVTVIDLRPNLITQVKSLSKNGYQGVQIGVLEKKEKAANKSERGHTKASSSTGFYHYQEFRLFEGEKLDGLTVGKILSAGFLKAGDLVDLTSMSKGKGFQGGMKRFHMAGGHKTHGCSVSHRSLGSIGNRADPGRCFKNKKMPGQMGHDQVTIQNVRVIRVDEENQLLLVNGSVPGPKSGIVTVRRAVKSAG
ncbi:50S ribosomal protein L3 [Bdellovibrionota bacterium FG-2]